MNILIVTTVSSTFNFFVFQIEDLKRQGHKVSIASNLNKKLNPKIANQIDQCFHVDFERNPFSINNWKAINKIRDIVSDNQYDVIHTHTPIASFITRIAIKNKIKGKLIYTAHGFHFYRGSSVINWLLYWPIEKLAIRWTDDIITINEEDYYIAKHMAKNTQCNVHHIRGVGLNIDEINNAQGISKESLGFKDSDILLIFVGELNANKNQIELIKFIGKTIKSNSNVKLLLCGEGPEKKNLEREITSKGLNKYIHLMGYRNDVYSLLKTADIYVSASKREGLPVNVLEAMAVGIPILVSDIRGHRDLINNGYNGFLVNFEEADFLHYWDKINNKKHEFSNLNKSIIKKYDYRLVNRLLHKIYFEKN